LVQLVCLLNGSVSTSEKPDRGVIFLLRLIHRIQFGNASHSANRYDQNTNIDWWLLQKESTNLFSVDGTLANYSVKSRLVGLPDISNNVGPVKSFFERTSPVTPKSGLPCSVDLCFDDHGSLVIFRSASVRPKHLFDQNFDHDYQFKLPLRGSGMPHQVHGVLPHTMSGTELSRVRTEL
jgi:hypothetical protein